MRRTVLPLVIFAMFATAGWAGETARVPLLNGVYSVEAPSDWYVEQEDSGGSTTFAPTKGAPNMVLFIAPNPLVEGEIAKYAGLMMGMVFKKFGGGAVTAEEEGEFKGHPSIMFHFAIPAGDDSYQGLANVFDIDGYAIICIAMAPGSQLKSFWEQAGPIIESYEFNADAAEENHDVLVDLAKQAFSDIEKELQ